MRTLCRLLLVAAVALCGERFESPRPVDAYRWPAGGKVRHRFSPGCDCCAAAGPCTVTTGCCSGKCMPNTLYITINTPTSCSSSTPSIAGSYTLTYYDTFVSGTTTFYRWYADPNPGLPGGDFDGTDLDISFQAWYDSATATCTFRVYLYEPSPGTGIRYSACWDTVGSLPCKLTLVACSPFELSGSDTMTDGTNSCTVTVTVTE